MYTRRVNRISRQNGHHGSQESIRLFIILLYFLFVIPGILIARMRSDIPMVPSMHAAVSAAIILLFLGLELLEYGVWHYRYRNRKVLHSFFFLRLALLVAPSVMTRFDSSVLNLSPEIAALYPLLPLYAYFAFSRPVSITLSVLLVAVPIVVGISGYGFSPGPRPGSDAVGFFIYRVIVIVFFYLLAWLWDTERKRSDENQRLLEDLHESESRLRDFAERVSHAVALEERTRLARDLHDSIGHALTAITIQLNKAKAYYDVDGDESRAAVEAARQTAADAMRDVRESLGSLNGEDAGINLRESLPRLVAQLENSGHTVNLTFTGGEDGYNYAVLIGLYRFVQEGITNILKHAGASHVEIRIDLGPEEGTASIRDDGRGFTPGALAAAGNGATEDRFGLRGLRRRLELVRGFLEVESSPGSGTALTVRVPRNPLALIGTHDDR